MLGGFTMGDSPQTGVQTGVPAVGRAQNLLAFILLAPQRNVRREQAAETLWPETRAEASRKAMRQALWRIHRATDATVPESERLILSDREALHVNPERPVWVDVPVLTQAARVARAEGADLADRDLDQLQRAADLYRGPLLAGCYEDWCLAPRARIEDSCLTVLDTLSRAYERRGHLDASIDWALRLLEVEPAHELSHLRLMAMHYRNGDRTRALRQFRQCRRVLQEELGVIPAARTRALESAIVADRDSDVLRLAPTPVMKQRVTV